MAYEDQQQVVSLIYQCLVSHCAEHDHDDRLQFYI